MEETMTIIKPMITEKSMQEAGKGKFTFHVGRRATKPAIKRAIEHAFSVNVIHVATVTVKGRTARVGKKRGEVQLSSWKKAIVTLKKDQKITLFDITGGEKQK